MNNIKLLVITIALAFCSCTEKQEEGTKHYAPLKNPTKVLLEQTAFSTDVLITWQDNCDNEVSYDIYVKDSKSETVVASLPADSQQYMISGVLNPGKTYSIGVRAISGGPMLSSQIIYKEITVFDYSTLPTAELRAEPFYTPTSVTVSYSFNKSDKYPHTDWGLCWDDEHSPTIEDDHVSGAHINSLPVKQMLTAAELDYNKTYKLRVYVTCEKGTTYSEQIEVCLNNEPSSITLEWNKVENSNLPADVQLYKTTSKLNGRAFNAWYAIADVTKGDVEFRMEFSQKAMTLEDFHSESNLVMTNAGYFNMTTGETGDFHAFEGVLFPAKNQGQARGTFGVDKSQKPEVYWSNRDANNIQLFYESPVYTVDTESWDPHYAMTAGPLLISDGKIMIDLTLEGGSLIRNYENIASDIFSATLTPDRTAVGYTEDGKVILFVCDGRITESQGASILELAQIMKGLGCVGAVNFDGGGSTAMTVFGKRINSLKTNTSGREENRPVGSVMGFYKK